MKEDSIFLFCVLLCSCTGVALVSARVWSGAGMLAPLFLGIAVFLVCGAKNPVPGLVMISCSTVLTLAFRFSALTWGDPWQDYESVIEVLSQGSTAMVGYRLQQPVLPGFIATLTLVTGYSPLLLQKLAVPLVSALSAPLVYLFSRKYVDDSAALAGSLLFLAGIPYIHWASQGVRETLGIPFFLFALFFSVRMMNEGKLKDMLILIPVLSGLILTHHQSALMYIVIFSGIILVYLFCYAGRDEMRRVVWTGCIPIGMTLLLTLFWWAFRIPFIFSSFIITVNQVLFIGGTNPVIPLSILAITGMLLRVIPLFFPGGIIISRAKSQVIVGRIYRIVPGIQICGVIAGMVIGVLIISGTFPLVSSYSPLMILPILVIGILAILALDQFFMKERFFFLIWAGIPGLMLVGGMTVSKLLFESGYHIEIDPLRFLNYLWPVITVIGSCTLVRMQNKRLLHGCITCFFVILYVNAFPPVVFDSIASDNRSLVISHPSQELLAIDWIEYQNVTSEFSSDRYAVAPARWLNPLGYQVVEPRGRPGEWSGASYWMITDRMKQYANFD
ncbi:MAG: glycosyltransferase family 39 protein, partial [Methanospirillum sp.]|uniref:glycosyltransferase family 39 protein n=1 Tax=Methanospirillum sp. TaxID=45200 RepID=UPI0023749BFE